MTALTRICIAAWSRPRPRAWCWSMRSIRITRSSTSIPHSRRLTGYPAAELLGRNLRLLQGDDREQDGRHRLREALGRGESCRVLLRNYRKDGSLFWNEMTCCR
jgi:PAS domain S-box-containing protein